MARSNIADLEYPALKHIAQGERRRSSVIYLTILLCVIFFFFVSYQLLQIDKHINQRVTKLTQAQEKLVRDAQKDSRTRTEEFRRYITCIFVIPIEKRTPENQLFCFRKSDLPGGRQESEFVPVEVNADDTAVAEIPNVPPSQNRQASASSSSSRVSSSSSNNTPTHQTSQPNTSQPSRSTPPTPSQPADNDGVIIDLPLLPPVHIGSPF